MVGVVIVAHGELARAFEEAARMIVGPAEAFRSCSFVQGTDVDDLRKRLKSTIKEANHGDGVVILTDMFGGTPSNLSLSFLETGRIEVVTGVNLPMVITALTKRDGKTIGELAVMLKESGAR
ncbi:MAG TPA: PTS sugar transporter subunit IIA, partial [Deltaproteobacteria bacterium]|nr:PTS sugar transporter subunit IIA [Deltaproteobacteria bacterium]